MILILMMKNWLIVFAIIKASHGQTTEDVDECSSIGGSRFDSSKFPGLVYISTKNEEKHCFGTLLSSTLVLTAASCLLKGQVDLENSIDVHSIPYYLDPKNLPQPKIIWNVIHIHNNYTANDYKHDIAVIELQGEGICLQNYTEVKNITGHEEGVSVVWSGVENGLTLCEVNIQKQDCIHAAQQKNDATFCAEMPGNGKGGPFMCDGTLSVCGIASSKKGVNKHLPGIFTNLEEYHDFIQKVMSHNNTPSCKWPELCCHTNAAPDQCKLTTTEASTTNNGRTIHTTQMLTISFIGLLYGTSSQFVIYWK